MKNSKSTQFKVSKDDFIDFLATATPEEVSDMIAKKGKPRKLIEPMIFFKDKKTVDASE